ncbi:MAG: DEAD/DEAH box helicase [Bdellovibrionales bacterium]|nr:DEAD/DEAH box helicase [Bdellovibrionales bacterium]
MANGSGSDNFDALFNELKGNALPGVWAKGLAIARNRQVSRDGRAGSDSSQKYRILVSDRVVKPLVTLWPKDMDYHCDCGDAADPCMHSVSAAIAEKNQWIETGANPEHPHPLPPTVQYWFETTGDTLSLRRTLGGQELRGSLVSHLGGTQTGRISGPTPQAVQADLQVDRIGSSFFRPSGATEIPKASVEALFKALSERNGYCFLDQKPVEVSARPVRRRFEITAKYRLEEIRADLTGLGPRIFKNGIVFSEFLSPKIELPQAVSEQISRRLSKNLSFSEMVDWMNSKEWETLLAHADVLDPKKLLPELERIPLRVQFHLEEHPGQVLTVLPRLLYGSPAIAEVSRSGDLEYLVESRAPIRGPEQIAEEKTLIRKVQQDFHLSIGQASKWESVQGVQMKEKLDAQVRKNPTVYGIAGQGQSGFGVSGRLKIQVQTVFSADGTLSLKPVFSIQDGGDVKTADPHRVLKAWEERVPLVPLLEGGWAELPKDLLDRVGDEIKRLLLRPRPVSRAGFPAVKELLETVGEPVHPLIHETVESLNAKLANTEKTDHIPAETLGLLRPYQRDAVHWLLKMKRLKTGAILADDMGLGKTLQALCAITPTDRVLLIVPTSVLSGWKGQIARFRPDLMLKTYYGQDRKLPDPSKAGILLTTHGTFRQDLEALSDLKWDVAIFDEAQAIKNPDSQLAIAASQIQAGFRMALSGTPIENRLLDLFSIFQFSEPALFGGRSEFLRMADQQPERIRSRIAPHFLRRLKKEVARDLPEKIETVLDCELSPKERDHYDAVFAATQKKVREALLGVTDRADGPAEMSSPGQPNMILALEALLRLRQASCDLRLVPGLLDQAAEHAASSKIRVLLDSLAAAIQNGHRCLVFSQWTSFLDLIEPELSKDSIRFSRIDGSVSVKDRASLIDQFQKDDGPSVMLLSLKAGGVGLTLTAADQVYLLDPWWNPAAEDQASDRAHRIGQTRTVQVHRLISEGTIEERILELAKKKRELTEAYLSDGSVAAGLSSQEILELIR